MRFRIVNTLIGGAPIGAQSTMIMGQRFLGAALLAVDLLGVMVLMIASRGSSIGSGLVGIFGAGLGIALRQEWKRRHPPTP